MRLSLGNNRKRKVNKKKLEIKPISLSDYEVSYIKAVLESNKTASRHKHMKVRSFLGGYCLTCSNLPSHEVHYHIAGVTIVRRYCEDCLKREKFI
jgi:hypothetical protein